MDWGGIIGAIMGTIATIVCGWFGYNQTAKNKEVEYKIAKREEEDKEKHTPQSQSKTSCCIMEA